ncbi:MAG TPA: hypothetical protein VHE30_24725 [Polyangiaceae bacterium]|nr:hypothetical protein [Polyangiaceae bacterium]
MLRTTASSGSRAVHIRSERGFWRVFSDDGAVGGTFVSREAARRYALREYWGAQGRPVIEDPIR